MKQPEQREAACFQSMALANAQLLMLGRWHLHSSFCQALRLCDGKNGGLLGGRERTIKTTSSSPAPPQWHTPKKSLNLSRSQYSHQYKMTLVNQTVQSSEDLILPLPLPFPMLLEKRKCWGVFVYRRTRRSNSHIVPPAPVCKNPTEAWQRASWGYGRGSMWHSYVWVGSDFFFRPVLHGRLSSSLHRNFFSAPSIHLLLQQLRLETALLMEAGANRTPCLT